MKKCLLLLGLLQATAPLYAQQSDRAGEAPASHTFYLCPDDVAWKDATAPLPPGAKVYLVEGNPKEAAQFTLRVWLPAWYKLPPHRHPVAERTTVLSGTLFSGYGDKMDTLNATRYAAGCFYFNPPGAVHYSFTSGEPTVIQISTIGPWDLTFTNTKEEKEEGK